MVCLATLDPDFRQDDGELGEGSGLMLAFRPALP